MMSEHVAAVKRIGLGGVVLRSSGSDAWLAWCKQLQCRAPGPWGLALPSPARLRGAVRRLCGPAEQRTVAASRAARAQLEALVKA